MPLPLLHKFKFAIIIFTPANPTPLYNESFPKKYFSIPNSILSSFKNYCLFCVHAKRERLLPSWF